MSKVLIIENDEFWCRLLTEDLGDMGLDSIYTIDYDAALFHLYTDEFNVVILDPCIYDMIQGTGCEQGIHLFEKIRSEDKTLPVIFYSVRPDLIDKEISSNNFTANILKSSDRSNLFLALNEFISLDENKLRDVIYHPNNEITIFISYAKEDYTKAYAIYQLLKQNKYTLWIDTENLLPGQDFDLEIEKAIQNSNFFIACLSNNSVTKEGFVQKELKRGLDMLDRKPESAIYLIPLKLDECEVPKRFEKLHWCNFTDKKSTKKLIESIEAGCKQRGLLSKKPKKQYLKPN